MKFLLAFYLIALCGCSSPKENVAALDASRDESSAEAAFDYDGFMAHLRSINYDANGYELFQSTWSDMQSQLTRAAENGAINRLPMDKRKSLWWEIEYMRACAHPSIFMDHSDEIIPILFAFDLPELNQQLREILVESGQI